MFVGTPGLRSGSSTGIALGGVSRLADGHIQLLSQGLRIRGMREDGAGNCVHSVSGAEYTE